MVGKGRWIVAGLVIALIFAGVFVLLTTPRMSRRLPDGTTLRVEQVAFGKRDDNFYPRSLYERTLTAGAKVLPKKIMNWLPAAKSGGVTPNGSWWTGDAKEMHTNLDELHIWLSRRDATNGLMEVNTYGAELLDSRGFRYPATQVGGKQMMSGGGGGFPPQSALTWFTFEAYPRHE